MTLFDTDTLSPEQLIEDLPPLRTTWHEEVKQLRQKRQAKREELDELKQRKRRSLARKKELESEFEAALDGDSDRDPREVREERLKVEEEADTFQENRLILKHEVAEAEQELEEAAEEAASRTEDALEEKVPPLLEELVGQVEATGEVLLPVLAVVQKVSKNNKSIVGHGRARINAPWSRDVLGKMNRFKRAARQLLEQLRADGYDIDENLINALENL